MPGVRPRARSEDGTERTCPRCAHCVYEATFLLPEDLLELVAEREAGRPFGQRAG